MKFDKQQILIIVLATVIIGGFVVFQYYPMFTRAMDNRQARIQGRADSYEMGRKVSEYELLRTQVKELQPVAETYERCVPDKPDFARLWSQITEIMKAHDLHDHLVQPGEEQKGDKLICRPLKIECTGTINQIHGLFKSLDELERKIRIENVNIANDQEYSGLVKLVADARIYYQAG